MVGRDPRRLERANGQLGATLTVGQQLAGPPAGAALLALPVITTGAVRAGRAEAEAGTPRLGQRPG